MSALSWSSDSSWTICSYRELNARVNATAAALRRRGVGRGDIVALLSENRPEYVETVLALNRLGRGLPVAQLPARTPEWQYILDHAGASLVVAAEPLWERLATVAPERERIRFGGELEALLEDGAEVRDADVVLEDTQRLMYTSGRRQGRRASGSATAT